MTTTVQVDQALSIVQAVADSIREAGRVPAGHLYAALMRHGCSLSSFELVIGVLCDAKLVRHTGNELVWIGPAEGGTGVSWQHGGSIHVTPGGSKTISNWRFIRQPFDGPPFGDSTMEPYCKHCGQNVNTGQSVVTPVGSRAWWRAEYAGRMADVCEEYLDPMLFDEEHVGGQVNPEFIDHCVMLADALVDRAFGPEGIPPMNEGMKALAKELYRVGMANTDLRAACQAALRNLTTDRRTIEGDEELPLIALLRDALAARTRGPDLDAAFGTPNLDARKAAAENAKLRAACQAAVQLFDEKRNCDAHDTLTDALAETKA